jgi:hypothetical protein
MGYVTTAMDGGLAGQLSAFPRQADTVDTLMGTATGSYTGLEGRQPVWNARKGLVALPEWTQLSVTDAAQLVQRSARPQAYAQWEPRARAAAAAPTGAEPGGVDLPRGPADGVLSLHQARGAA